MATLVGDIKTRDLHPVHSVGARIGITMAILILAVWYLGGKSLDLFNGFGMSSTNPGSMGTVNEYGRGDPAGTPSPSIYYKGSWSDIQHGSFSPIWGSQAFHSSSY